MLRLHTDGMLEFRELSPEEKEKYLATLFDKVVEDVKREHRRRKVRMLIGDPLPGDPNDEPRYL